MEEVSKSFIKCTRPPESFLANIASLIVCLCRKMPLKYRSVILEGDYKLNPFTAIVDFSNVQMRKCKRSFLGSACTQGLVMVRSYRSHLVRSHILISHASVVIEGKRLLLKDVTQLLSAHFFRFCKLCLDLSGVNRKFQTVGGERLTKPRSPWHCIYNL